MAGGTELSDAMAANGGWIVSALIALWAAVLRTTLGRHYRSIDSMNERLGKIEMDVAFIKGQMNDSGSHRRPIR